MKYKLVIEADSPEEIKAAAEKLGAASPVTAPAESFTPITPLQELVARDQAAAEAAPAPVEAPAAPATAGAVELDKDGIPWDERIHSSNQKKTKKGVWSRRKNVQDSRYDQIVAELKAAQQGAAPAPVPDASAAPLPLPLPVPDATPPAAPPQPAPSLADHPMHNPALGPTPSERYSPPTPPAAPPQPAPQPIPDAVLPPGAGEVVTFPALMQRLNMAVQNQVITNDDIPAVCQALNLTNLMECNGNDNLCGQVVATFAAMGKAI